MSQRRAKIFVSSMAVAHCSCEIFFELSVDAMAFGSFPINNDDNSRMIISMTGKIETGDYARFINVFKIDQKIWSLLASY